MQTRLAKLVRKPQLPRLYFEPGTGGHRAAFLSAVLIYGKDSWVIACPKALIEQLNDSERRLIAPTGTIRHIDINTEYKTNFKSVREQWTLSQSIAAELGCESIFHPMIDLFIQYSPLLTNGSVRSSGIYFRPMQHYDALTARDRAIATTKDVLGRYFVSRSDIGALFSLDRYFPAWTRPRWKFAHKIRFLPDFVPVSQDTIRATKTAKRTLPSDRIRFLLFGALQRRKGVFDVLDAVEMMQDELAGKCDLRFCGRLSTDASKFANRVAQVAGESPANIVIEDRFFSDEELSHEVTAADVILAPYHWHRGSSGVLYWAAAFGKPVIGQNFGLVGLEVQRFSLGLCVRPRDAKNLAEVLSDVVRNGGLKVDPAEQQLYLTGHTANEFARLIEDGMARI